MIMRLDLGTGAVQSSLTYLLSVCYIVTRQFRSVSYNQLLIARRQTVQRRVAIVRDRHEFGMARQNPECTRDHASASALRKPKLPKGPWSESQLDYFQSSRALRPLRKLCSLSSAKPLFGTPRRGTTLPTQRSIYP